MTLNGIGDREGNVDECRSCHWFPKAAATTARKTGYISVVTSSLLMLVRPGFLAAQESGGAAAGRTVPKTPLARQSGSSAFVDVTVIPMDRERVLPHQTVVVQGDRIIALGPTRRVPVPTGARRIDGRGKFLIPGLADMHAHTLEDTNAYPELAGRLYAFVANGVTTIRTMYSGGPSILTARARAAKGELVSPRIYAAAGPLESAAQVIAAKDSGYDLVKVYGVDGPALDSLAATAHRLGLPVAGHTPSYGVSSLDVAAGGLQRAIEVGYASAEHLTGFDNYLGSPSYWSPRPTAAETYQMLADTAKLQRMAVALRRASVWICPTLAMFEGMRAPIDTWPEMRYVRPEIQQRLKEGVKMWRAPDSATVAMLEVRLAIVRALHAAGTGLLLGTDTPVPGMVPGFAVHRELEAFVLAGLRPYEALATGTRNVAAYLGTLDSTGTVAVGKRADLVLLSRNPLENVGHTRHPAGVMLGGRWLSRAALDRGLAALEGTLQMVFM